MKALVVRSMLILLALSAAHGAWAQSFSCKNVHQCPELAICNTPELGSLDVEMAQLYFGLRDLSSRPAAATLLENQQEWLEQRSRCGCDKVCLIKLYRSRIRELRSLN